MSKRVIGLLFLLAGSVALGVLQGVYFFRLFEKTVPPLALSSFSESAAHVTFLGYGVASGVCIFLLALAAVLISPAFRNRSGARTAPPGSIR